MRCCLTGTLLPDPTAWAGAVEGWGHLGTAEPHCCSSGEAPGPLCGGAGRGRAGQGPVPVPAAERSPLSTEPPGGGRCSAPRHSAKGRSPAPLQSPAPTEPRPPIRAPPLSEPRPPPLGLLPPSGHGPRSLARRTGSPRPLRFPRKHTGPTRPFPAAQRGRPFCLGRHFMAGAAILLNVTGLLRGPPHHAHTSTPSPPPNKIKT